MALGGFATGALVTAPVVAVLTWLAVTWQQHVDVRVERDTVVARADRAVFNSKFDDEWARLSGNPKSACDGAAVDEITKLRTRLGELEAKLTASTDTLAQDRADLEAVMKGQPK